MTDEEEQKLIHKCKDLQDQIDSTDNPVTQSVLKDILTKKLEEYKQKFNCELVICRNVKLNFIKEQREI